MTRAVAAQRLWRNLAALCDEAGQGGLTTDEIGYVLVEFALSVFSLTFSKQQMLDQVGVIQRDVEGDRIATINALTGKTAVPLPNEWSWIRSLSPTEGADPQFWDRKVRQVARLAAYDREI
jgi:hypothetical protein